MALSYVQFVVLIKRTAKFNIAIHLKVSFFIFCGIIGELNWLRGVILPNVRCICTMKGSKNNFAVIDHGQSLSDEYTLIMSTLIELNIQSVGEQS